MARYLLTGTVMGLVGVLLAYVGNPANTGLCVSCFLENIAGALGLHGNERMQYLRPEILGIVIGAFVVAASRRTLKPTSSGSALLRFLVGNLLIVGGAVFLGCPIKMMLRLSAGDMTALAGLGGLIVGVFIGIQFIEGGFRTGRSIPVAKGNAYLLPGLAALLLVALFVRPSFIEFSVKGAGAQYAPVALALGAGLLVGGLGQWSRFCITAGIARLFLWGGRQLPGCPKTTGLLVSLGALMVTAVVANVATGQFSFGLLGQPSSNDSYGWAFLAMVLVGFGSILIRGCPFRQLVLAGQGDVDAGSAVLGMLSGAALVQVWGLAGNAAGTPYRGKVAVLLGLAVLLVLATIFRDRRESR